MEIGFDLINGLSLGAEYVSGIDEEFDNTIIVDILIFRLLIQWS